MTAARALVPALIFTCLLGAPSGAAAQGCAHAQARAGEASEAALTAALMCVTNAARAAAGLKPVADDGRLAGAARAHAGDMVTRRFFSHTSPSGGTLADRLDAVGWRGERGGEVLAYGCGALQTPLATVVGWLESPAHRALLLERDFDIAGAALASGAPVDGCEGLTWAMVLGAKPAATPRRSRARRASRRGRSTRRARAARSKRAHR